MKAFGTALAADSGKRTILEKDTVERESFSGRTWL
jgi:hypothetical protein